MSGKLSVVSRQDAVAMVQREFAPLILIVVLNADGTRTPRCHIKEPAGIDVARDYMAVKLGSAYTVTVDTHEEGGQSSPCILIARNADKKNKK